MSTECLVFNGINGATGDYLLPAMVPEQGSKITRGEMQDKEHIKALEWWYGRVTKVLYNLLIVSSPEETPYRFQYHLDVSTPGAEFTSIRWKSMLGTRAAW